MRSCLAGSHARSVLQDGDFLLTVAGRPVSHFQAVEAALACSAGGQAAASLGAPAASSALWEWPAAVTLERPPQR